ITVYWGATGPFSGGIDLGASDTQLEGSSNFHYPQLTNALRNDRTTAADSNSVASLPASDPTSSGKWYLTRSEAKALGVLGISQNDNVNDGSIGFASDVSYTFDPTNRAVPGRFDFIGVAEHEITEVMGRSTYDLTTAFLPFDLFRFTSSGTRSLDPNASNVYFSINDGVTALKYFSPNNGDDIQDWTASTPPDSYDAVISSGESGKLSSADLTAVDIIGYKLNFQPPRLTGATLANGNFQISFTNVSGMNFLVLASTNISASVGNWTTLGSPTESPAGQYQFTYTQANKTRFYRVSLP
ncbi:MAG: NF038122 family metalloprotease, partial [Limisphaerales bacterium]